MITKNETNDNIKTANFIEFIAMMLNNKAKIRMKVVKNESSLSYLNKLLIVSNIFVFP